MTAAGVILAPGSRPRSGSRCPRCSAQARARCGPASSSSWPRPALKLRPAHRTRCSAACALIHVRHPHLPWSRSYGRDFAGGGGADVAAAAGGGPALWPGRGPGPLGGARPAHRVGRGATPAASRGPWVDRGPRNGALPRGGGGRGGDGGVGEAWEWWEPGRPKLPRERPWVRGPRLRSPRAPDLHSRSTALRGARYGAAARTRDAASTERAISLAGANPDCCFRATGSRPRPVRACLRGRPPCARAPERGVLCAARRW